MLLNSGEFSFRTLDECRVLTTLLAAACPDPAKVATGLSEMLINAVEHGNLGISYADKSHLLATHEWEQEIIRRLEQPEYVNLYVTVQFERGINQISIVIIDQGPERSSDSHGRGIAMANILSFDTVEYKGNGNEVKVTLNTAAIDNNNILETASQ